ncbi:MAG: Stf0 family sulfotransferase [Dongiaceae bacterium]
MGRAPKKNGNLTAAELRQDRVSAQLDQPGNPVRLSYLILAEMRSGSTLLADMLYRRGAGMPFEYFNDNYRHDLTARLFSSGAVPSTEEYLERVRDLRTTANGYFGVKCLLPQLRQFGEDFPPQRFIERFDRIVFLTQRNKLAQAISAMRAQQSGQWTSTLAPDNDRKVMFDPVFISARLRDFLARERSVRVLIERIDRPKILLEYEDIETSLKAVWRELQAFLDLAPVELDGGTIGLNRQADAQSAQSARRYLRLIQGRVLKSGASQRRPEHKPKFKAS